MLLDSDVEVNLGVSSFSSQLPCDLLMLSLLKLTSTPFFYLPRNAIDTIAKV